MLLQNYLNAAASRSPRVSAFAGSRRCSMANAWRWQWPALRLRQGTFAWWFQSCSDDRASMPSLSAYGCQWRQYTDSSISRNFEFFLHWFFLFLFLWFRLLYSLDFLKKKDKETSTSTSTSSSSSTFPRTRVRLFEMLITLTLSVLFFASFVFWIHIFFCKYFSLSIEICNLMNWKNICLTAKRWNFVKIFDNHRRYFHADLEEEKTKKM